MRFSFNTSEPAQCEECDAISLGAWATMTRSEAGPNDSPCRWAIDDVWNVSSGRSQTTAPLECKYDLPNSKGVFIVVMSKPCQPQDARIGPFL
jgi:hypothetical protein